MLEEEAKPKDVFAKKQAKRHREGYDDDVTSILFKTCPVRPPWPPCPCHLASQPLRRGAARRGSVPVLPEPPARE